MNIAQLRPEADPDWSSRAHQALLGAMRRSGRAVAGDRLLLVRVSADSPMDGLRQAILLREAADAGRINAALPLLEGGLMVAAADMAIASGTGMRLTAMAGVWGWAGHEALFGEEPGRFLVAASIAQATAARQRAEAAGSKVSEVGVVGGDELACDCLVSIPLPRLRAKYQGFFHDLSIASVGAPSWGQSIAPLRRDVVDTRH